jgi:hypothetical protein
MEKSSVGTEISIGESAYQNSQPQKPRTAAATARTKSLKRSSIEGVA